MLTDTQAKLRIWNPDAYTAIERREAAAHILGTLDASQEDLDQASRTLWAANSVFVHYEARKHNR